MGADERMPLYHLPEGSNVGAMLASSVEQTVPCGSPQHPESKYTSSTSLLNTNHFSVWNKIGNSLPITKKKGRWKVRMLCDVSQNMNFRKKTSMMHQPQIWYPKEAPQKNTWYFAIVAEDLQYFACHSCNTAHSMSIWSMLIVWPQWLSSTWFELTVECRSWPEASNLHSGHLPVGPYLSRGNFC